MSVEVGETHQPPIGARPVAVVTGSSSGIGRAIAVQLAQQGFDILVHAGRNIKRAEESVAIVRSFGVDSHAIVYDYSQDSDDFESFVQQAFAWRGSVDCWVNNAGGDVLTNERRTWSFTEKLDYLWRVDVRATLLISRLVAERMKTNLAEANFGTRSVINMGWDQAQTGLPGPSGQMFGCTKGAIMAMTSSLAKSYAPSVRFNCVAPGWIRTQWGEEADPVWSGLVAQQSLLRRWGSTHDVAATVGFLASNAAVFVNGQCIAVNGGLGDLSAEMRDRLC
ncbi:MAG: SDR family oxidoreductase [Planctomycetaceae bacterium]|jgi:3-oxoacyl-[acyl-carrier protein] reductase|nr:SDR family oxidoreductase [Planctomycetaceae bacterium]